MRDNAGAFVISLDFELYWGVRDLVTLDAYRTNLEGVHVAVPRMLDLFSAHDVHATWACVGLLFARDQEEARHFAPELRPTYVRQELSPYGALDRPGLDTDSICYFAPHLVREICSRPHQEIATHTFSHFYCGEPGQTAAQFEADLSAAIAISTAHGCSPTGLVFPRNQCNEQYLPVLLRQGVHTYRGLQSVWMLQRGASWWSTSVRRCMRLADNYIRLSRDLSTEPRRARKLPHNVPGSRFLRPYSPTFRPLAPLRSHRLCQEMTAAAESGKIYHLWWHPHNFGRNVTENLGFLEGLLHHARHLRDVYDFRSMTMAEVARGHSGE